MTPLIIIQARLNSKRLPGKVLMPINGEPLLAYLVKRLAKRDAVIATPSPEIADYIKAYWGQGCLVIGPEEDVAERFRMALVRYPYTPFIRLCADSPLIDPALIDAAIALYESPYLEIVSPVGCVEVCDTATFLAGLPNMSPHEREHVTMLLRPLGRTIHVGSGPRLVVDTQADFDRVRGVIEKMDRPHTEYGWRECVSLL